MKKIILMFTLAAFVITKLQAQVKDISFTLSPAAEYTWWDNKAGLEDNVMVGGKLGFGFGEYLELRAIYMQSIDQQTQFESFGLTTYDDMLFNAQDVDITRWGGEFKANIGTKRLKPYVTLGTGIQNISLNDTDFEQIYATAGLGVKFNIAKRFVFALEAKNTTFRFNSGENLLSEDDKMDFGITDADFESDRLSNWSVQGSLQFYLGGRKPEVLSDLDKAYLQKFKGGFKGLQFVLEPGFAYTDFDDNSLLRDTYWLGGFAGIDFNEYIGVRAFYFQATEDEELSTSFDDLSIYGLEFRARLNDGNGVVPFLTLGGGYLNPSNSYTTSTAVNSVNVTNAESGAFATGGLGLNIPLGKYVLISGGARAMLTSGDNVTDISNTNDIQSNIFYNAGIKFTLGKKATAPEIVYQENVNKILNEKQAQNEAKLENLKTDYAKKIAKLEEELKQAYQAKDVDKALEILEEKKDVEEALREVKDVEKVQEQQVEEKVMEEAKKQDIAVTKKDSIAVKNMPLVKSESTLQNKSSKELIQMTPTEFESLIDRILKGLDEEEKAQTPMSRLGLNTNTMEGNQQRQMELLNERINTLEKLLLEINTKQGFTPTQENTATKQDDLTKKILEKLDELNQKIDGSTAKKNIEASENGIPKTVIITPADEKKIITSVDENGSVIESKTVGSGKSKLLSYNNSSVLLGVSFGELTTANVGVRLDYDFNNSVFKFVPEVFAGFGNTNIWGISGNVVYPFSLINSKFNPYAGAGLGIGDLGNNFKGFYNLVIGTSIPVLNNHLFFDYTMRNSFDYNQISLGYRLKF